MTATDQAVELVEIAAAAAADKLATDILAYDVSEQLVITDIFLLCSAANDRQVKAVVDEIEARLQQQAGVNPVRREGEREGRWVLLDYLDVVIHIQNSEERVFYALERLWKDCPVVPLPEAAGVGRGRPANGVGGSRDRRGADGGDGAGGVGGARSAGGVGDGAGGSLARRAAASGGRSARGSR